MAVKNKFAWKVCSLEALDDRSGYKYKLVNEGAGTVIDCTSHRKKDDVMSLIGKALQRLNKKYALKGL